MEQHKKSLCYMQIYYTFTNFLLLTTPYNFKNDTYENSIWRKLYVLLWYLVFFSTFILSLDHPFLANGSATITDDLFHFVQQLLHVIVHTILAFNAIFRQETLIKLLRTFLKFDDRAKFIEKTSLLAYWCSLIFVELFLIFWNLLDFEYVTIMQTVRFIINKLKMLTFYNIDLLICHVVLSLKQRFRFVNEQIDMIAYWRNKNENLIVSERIYLQFSILCELVETFNKIYGWQLVFIFLRTLIRVLSLINNIIMQYSRHKTLNTFMQWHYGITALMALVSINCY